MAQIHACRSPSQQSGKRAWYVQYSTNTTTRLQSEGLLENFNPGTHARRGLGIKQNKQEAAWDAIDVCTVLYLSKCGRAGLPPQKKIPVQYLSGLTISSMLCMSEVL